MIIARGLRCDQVSVTAFAFLRQFSDAGPIVGKSQSAAGGGDEDIQRLFADVNAEIGLW